MTRRKFLVNVVVELITDKGIRMTKYLETRKKADGRKYYAFNPSKGVKDALGLKYRKFTDKREAEKYCRQVALEFNLHRRKNEGRVAIHDESVQALINFYKSTQEWEKLKENSQICYDLCFKSATETVFGQSNVSFGETKARNVTATQADRLYAQIVKDFSSHRANQCIKVLRKVYNVGFRHDRVIANPFSNMQIPGLPSRKVLWEPEQVFHMIQTADDMGYRSIGTLTLLCYDLCSRPGDMRQLRWDNYKGGLFKYTQEKTGTDMEVPASPRLIERLESITNRQDEIAICETTANPYSKDLLVKYFARIRLRSGLPKELQLRDLRRTGATEMAESGCTEDELRAVTGHQSREILATYVRPTTRLATSAVNKRFA